MRRALDEGTGGRNLRHEVVDDVCLSLFLYIFLLGFSVDSLRLFGPVALQTAQTAKECNISRNRRFEVLRLFGIDWRRHSQLPLRLANRFFDFQDLVLEVPNLLLHRDEVISPAVVVGPSVDDKTAIA